MLNGDKNLNNNNNNNWRNRRQANSLFPLTTSGFFVTTGVKENENINVTESEDPNEVKNIRCNKIIWFNRFAYCVHGIILASLLIVYATKATSSVSTRLTTNTLFIQWGNSTLGGIGGCLAEKHYAPPNELSFKADDPKCTGSDVVTLSVMPFPKRTDYYLSIVGLTLSFFALSFTFQLATEFIGKPIDKKKKSFCHLYQNMFSSDYQKDDNGMVLKINWLRYVEYSISASIMMLAISLVAGIYDFDLLLCIFFLTWACMLCGYGSEVLIRIRQVLYTKKIAGNQVAPLEQSSQPLLNDVGRDNVNEKDKKLHEIISNLSLWGAIGMHIVGWVCVVVPWYIIMTHNLSLWGSSDKLSDCLNNMKVPIPQGVPACSVRRTVEPPSFVWGIMISQMLLFLLFGFVQVFQIFYPARRYEAEVTYIFLSMSAKLILGSFIAAFLFV
jgi:hypothetical protein